MNKVVFSSWAGDVVDGRYDSTRCAPAANFTFPMQFNGKPVKASMSWKGVVLGDKKINIVEMALAYLKESHRLACGECIVGYGGLQVMIDIVSKLLRGKGTQSDVDLLTYIGSGIQDNSKCSFCATAVTPVVDTLDYFQDDYRQLVGGKKATSKESYVVEVTAPCTQACPAHQDIPGYLELIRNRRYPEALELIRKTNCMPHATGRACVAFCEAKCVRNDIDSPLAIRALKRVPADYAVSTGSDLFPKKARARTARVAIIGAGPAGLACAYNLALAGYKITVFDDQPMGGGMAGVGIPAYRLPRAALGYDVSSVERLGVEFKFNTRLGVDITLDSLKKEGYSAVFLGTGAHGMRDMGIAGENEVKEGLINGVTFLHRVNRGEKVKTSGRAVIIGGGNVAIDCARTCLRLGFDSVTIVYRRSRTEMPGRKEEIEEAEREGVKIRFLATPTKVLSRNGKLIGIECIEMKLGEPDASHRRRPIAIPGSEFVIEADLLLPAVGEMPDLSFLKGSRVDSEGTIKVDPVTFQTAQPGVFAGGDAVNGPSTLIQSIGAGNRAASSIDQYIRSGKVTKTEGDAADELFNSVDLTARSLGMVAKHARHSPEHLPVTERLKDFGEVEKAFDNLTATKESGRCLRCYRVMLLALDKGK